MENILKIEFDNSDDTLRAQKKLFKKWEIGTIQINYKSLLILESEMYAFYNLKDEYCITVSRYE